MNKGSFHRLLPYAFNQIVVVMGSKFTHNYKFFLMLDAVVTVKYLMRYNCPTYISKCGDGVLPRSRAHGNNKCPFKNNPFPRHLRRLFLRNCYFVRFVPLLEDGILVALASKQQHYELGV